VFFDVFPLGFGVAYVFELGFLDPDAVFGSGDASFCGDAVASVDPGPEGSGPSEQFFEHLGFDPG